MWKHHLREGRCHPQTTERPQREPTLPTPSSRLQNYDRILFCCLSHLIHGSLLQQTSKQMQEVEITFYRGCHHVSIGSWPPLCPGSLGSYLQIVPVSLNCGKACCQAVVSLSPHFALLCKITQAGWHWPSSPFFLWHGYSSVSAGNKGHDPCAHVHRVETLPLHLICWRQDSPDLSFLSEKFGDLNWLPRVMMSRNSLA